MKESLRVSVFGTLAVALTLVTGNASAEGVTVDGRPFHLHVPTGYANRPVPLVILLHGYSVNSTTQDKYFGLGERADGTYLADDRTFLYAYPDGTRDPTGNQFWRASNACCQFFGGLPPIDDVTYIAHIIEEVSRSHAVDPTRIYLVGHSNGAFMSHRVACDNPKIAAIVSLAGHVPQAGAGVIQACAANNVSVLQIHGDADQISPYSKIHQHDVALPWPPWPGATDSSGRSSDYTAVRPPPPAGPVLRVSFPSVFPTAMDTVQSWASRDGCRSPLANYGEIDIDRTLPGSETTRARFGGCPTGIDVELWTIKNGPHIPNLDQHTFGDTIYTWLYAHPKRPGPAPFAAGVISPTPPATLPAVLPPPAPLKGGK